MMSNPVQHAARREWRRGLLGPALAAGVLLLSGCRSSAPQQTAEPSTATSPQGVRPVLAQTKVPAARKASAGRTGLFSARLDAPACAPVSNDRIYRRIEGLEDCPQVLSASDIQAELNDPFATSVLRQNLFPITVDATVQAVVAGNPQFAAAQKNYMVGEGSQVPLPVAPREDNRSLRYALTWGPQGGNAEILLSANPGGQSSFLQVISWDAKKSRYNFYEYNTDQLAWSWAGDSSFARQSRTAGQGCFDCHHNGVLIMKELTVPWNNWQSQLATIDPQVVPQAVASEALFRNLSGAELLESSVRGGMQRYYNGWLRGQLQRQPDGSFLIQGVPELLRHVITQTTVNLASTQAHSNASLDTVPKAPITGLPKDFFVRDSVLRDVLGLSYSFPAKLQLERDAYSAFLKEQQFQLVQTSRTPYTQPGSTFFAFFVPQPPAEDTLVTQLLLSNKLVSDKLVASILMVDFANPVFSPTRDTLLKYAGQLPTGTLKAGQSDVPARFAARVSQGASGQPPCDTTKLDGCSAEQQFLFFWNQPDAAWKDAVQQRVGAYLAAVGQRIATAQGADDYLRLAVSRQQQFTAWPVIGNLAEFSLLLPRTHLPAQPPLRMKPDGTLGTFVLPQAPRPVRTAQP